MNKISVEQIGKHYLSEVQHASSDSEQWLAWLCLNNLYPTTKYWSMDGYHVHALVDYSRNILWEHDKIMTTDRAEVLLEVKNFYKATSSEIVQQWKRIIGVEE